MRHSPAPAGFFDGTEPHFEGGWGRSRQMKEILDRVRHALLGAEAHRPFQYNQESGRWEHGEWVDSHLGKHRNFVKACWTPAGPAQPVAALTAVMVVLSPGFCVWLAKRLNAEEGYGGRTLPPGARRKALLTVPPSAVLRDLHHRLSVGWLSRALNVQVNLNTVFTADERDPEPGRCEIFAKVFCGFFAMFYCPYAWPLLLPFCMAADGLMVALTGVAAIVEVAYFVLWYAAFTPSQMRAVVVAKLNRLHGAKDPRGTSVCVLRVVVHVCLRSSPPCYSF